MDGGRDSGRSPAARWAPPGWQAMLLVAPSLLWLAWDRTPWRTDQAWYGEVAVDLWWTLTRQPGNWWGLMMGAFGIKAPAISWLGQFLVPLGQWMGNVDDALLLLPCAAALSTVHLWFGIGCTLWSGDARGGWICAGLGAGSPLFIGLSHQFFVETLQLLGVTGIYWLALHGPAMPRLRLALRGVLAVCFLVSVKVTSLAFCFLPAAMIAWHLICSPQPWLGTRTRARAADAGVLALVLILTIPTALWYVRNFDALRDFVSFAAQSESSLSYGSRPEFFPKWNFWLSGVHREFFQPIVGFTVVPAALLLGVFSFRGSKSQATTGRALAVVAAVQGGLVLQGFALQIPEVTRYALAVLVSALIPLVVLLGCGPRRGVAAFVLVLAAIQWGWSHGVALRALPSGPRPSEWLWAADSDPDRQRTLDRLVNATTNPKTAYRYHVNGYELPWLNANNLAFHAAKASLSSGIRAYYTSLGFMAKDPAAALARVHAMEAESFISIDVRFQPPQPNFLNQVARDVLDAIRRDPRYVQVPFSSGHNIVLYRRIPNRQ